MTYRQSFTRSAVIAFLLIAVLPLTTGSANACPEVTIDPVSGAPTTQPDLQAALDALTEPFITAQASD